MELIWLRTSLRLLDNPIWQHSQCDQAWPANKTVIITPCTRQYRDHGYGDRRMARRDEQIAAFVDLLETARITVTVLKDGADTYREAADAVLAMARQQGATTVWADREYGLNERRRDSWLGKRLNADGIDFNLIDDRLTYPPETMLTAQGNPYQVFTAFKNAWRKRLQYDPRPPFPRPRWAERLPAPEENAQQALTDYCEQRLDDYERDRNRLTQPQVSGLSPDIANGLLTTRQAFAASQHANDELRTPWLNEWVWREFFFAVGFHFPQVYQHRALQPWTEGVTWSRDEALLEAWKKGQTGYPVVDAAMRQLAATGQMPNRARMFTAAFLTKDLLLDWRLGEAWFLDQLVDADYAVNNGNWQWGASTGVDAAPYFRIFNPTRQAERFDPTGDYVRQWVPELAELPDKSLLDPAPLERQAAGYPAPLVIHKEAATRTKNAFSQAKDKAAQGHD